jgi:FAD/FMN-containing dehydrogenase
MNRPEIQALAAELGSIPHSNEAALVRQKSRDFHWFSPILKAELRPRHAELVVAPRTEAEVLQVASLCARHRMPLVARGAGTGNFGQAVPLAGGVILDMTAMDAVRTLSRGSVRAQAGITLGALDQAAGAGGRELRMHPSTRRTATLGGFLAGGHAGIGSVTWGILRDRGNIGGIRLATIEREPRVLDLRGDDVLQVHHAYGVNGIILDAEMPLTSAEPWIELVVAFEQFDEAARFGLALGSADGIVKKLVTPLSWPIPHYFPALGAACPAGAAVVLCMVAEASLAAVREEAAAHGGRITLECAEGEGPNGVPIYEYAWGHTTFQAIKHDPAITYLICLFPPDDPLAAVARVQQALGDELWMHLEAKRFNGRPTVQGVPVFRYRDRAQLARLTAELERLGCRVANGHTWYLQNGGMKAIDAAQIAFKRDTDPYGLMNPGKIAGLGDLDDLESAGAALPAEGWTYDRI